MPPRTVRYEDMAGSPLRGTTGSCNSVQVSPEVRHNGERRLYREPGFNRHRRVLSYEEMWVGPSTGVVEQGFARSHQGRQSLVAICTARVYRLGELRTGDYGAIGFLNGHEVLGSPLGSRVQVLTQSPPVGDRTESGPDR